MQKFPIDEGYILKLPRRPKKNTAANFRRHHSSPARSGTRVLGRVNPDFAGFVWDLTDSEIKSAAASVSKHIEIIYQAELLRSSGFGTGNSEDE